MPPRLAASSLSLPATPPCPPSPASPSAPLALLEVLAALAVLLLVVTHSSLVLLEGWRLALLQRFSDCSPWLCKHGSVSQGSQECGYGRVIRDDVGRILERKRSVHVEGIIAYRRSFSDIKCMLSDVYLPLYSGSLQCLRSGPYIMALHHHAFDDMISRRRSHKRSLCKRASRSKDMLVGYLWAVPTQGRIADRYGCPNQQSLLQLPLTSPPITNVGQRPQSS